MSRPAKADIRNEYAYWCATTKRLRVSLGLPLTDQEFAKVKSVDPRTLRRWKQSEEFKNDVLRHKNELANSRPNSAISKVNVQHPPAEKLQAVTNADDPVLDPTMSVDEQNYLQVKDTLIRMAQDGNQGAIDLYLKHYGKSFVESERQEFKDYEDYSDDRLADEVLRWVGVEFVSNWLASQAAVEA
jgi:hypothetical protein